MMQVDIGKLLDLKIELEKKLETVSGCANSSDILKSEIYLGSIRDLKIDYQLEIEIFVDKFRPVLKDVEILDEWIKEQDEIGNIVKEHADIA